MQRRLSERGGLMMAAVVVVVGGTVEMMGGKCTDARLIINSVKK
jgi:hypothetical protein